MEQSVELFYAISSIGVLISLIEIGASLADHEHISQPLIKGFLGLMAIMGPTFAVGVIAPRRLSWPILITFTIGLYSSAVYLLDPSLKHPWSAVMHATPPKATSSVAYAILIGASGLVVIALLAIPLSILNTVTVGQLERRYPNVVVLGLLLRARRALAEHSVSMSDPNFKNYVCRFLEDAAKRLENSLPKSIPMSHDYVQSQLQERCVQASAELRMMQVRLALSDDSTLDKIREEITSFIYIIATGSYGLLPTTQPLPHASKIKKIANVSRDITIAFAPLAVVAVSRYLGLQLSTSFGNWIVTITIIWAAVSIASILDPLYKSKIADLREISSMILRRGR